MVPYILGYLLCIYTVRAWHRSLIMVGMTESGDPATGNINHASVIRHEFGCTCGVVDNLTPLGAHLIHDVLWNRDQVFFFTSKFKSYFYIKKNPRIYIMEYTG